MRSPSNRPLGKPARKHHFLLNTQCFGEFTPHQLNLSRLRKIMSEEHHLYSARLQAQASPGIRTYRDAPFPARQTPREHQIAARVSVAHGGAEQALRTVRHSQRCCLQTIQVKNSSRQENHELPCREQHTLPLLSPKSHQPLLHSVYCSYYNYYAIVLVYKCVIFPIFFNI